MRKASTAGAIFLAGGAVLLGVSHSPSAAAGSRQEADSAAVMKDLSSGFTGLEKALREGDGEAISKGIAVLHDAYPCLKTLKLADAPELPEEFHRHVVRFGELLDEIGQLAQESRGAGAEQAFDELRATCVSCHLKFRSRNEERGPFPARDNTVLGTVSLHDADGEFREDQSSVLVFLEPITPTSSYTWHRGSVRLSQKSRQFLPRVLPIVVGTTVEFPNDDTIFHNVFSLSKTKPFDLGIYKPGQTASVSMDQTGLVKVYCNIHPDMSASIVVLATPWFALTDRAGRFVVCNAPAGDYLLRAWNDLGAETSQSLTLGTGSDGPVSLPPLDLKESLRVVRHNNKFGNPYPEKY
jgi:plastocyanin/cytochrome c556